MAPASRIEVGLVFFESQFNDTVIVLGSEAVPMGTYKLGASVFGLFACQVNPDYLSPDFGRAQVQIASSHDCAKLVRQDLFHSDTTNHLVFPNQALLPLLDQNVGDGGCACRSHLPTRCQISVR